MLIAGRPDAPMVAKCYRLLRAILGTAVEDGLLAKNRAPSWGRYRAPSGTVGGDH
jgi:hypothetical protein